MNVTRRWLLYLGSTMALAFDAGGGLRLPRRKAKSQANSTTSA